MKKRSTKSESLKATKQEAADQIAALEAVNQQNLRLRNRKNDRYNAVFMSANALLVILAIVTGSWWSLLYVLTISVWLGICWALERHINNLLFVIDMQHDLHSLERAEVDKLIQSLPASVKGTK
jgi:hypothetical protein